jgi:hypothetical protein
LISTSIQPTPRPPPREIGLGNLPSEMRR